MRTAQKQKPNRNHGSWTWAGLAGHWRLFVFVSSFYTFWLRVVNSLVYRILGRENNFRKNRKI